MYFDSHAHYDDPRFDSDRFFALEELGKNGISNIINVGSDIETSKHSLELAEKYNFIYAAVGVHPHDVENMNEATLAEVACLAEHKKAVAIGEIGLDYHYENSPIEAQKFWFKKQMRLAWEMNLPVVIHSRDATEDTIKICRENKVHGGVIHCFSGSVETAKIFLDMGYHISFAGPITFKNAKSLPQVAKIVPEDRLLIETDSPYMAPEPYRGERNCSVYVKCVAERIAQIRGVEPKHIAEITSYNAKALFKIK